MSGAPLLLTGAAGKLAAMLRPALAEAGHRVRLSDSAPVEPIHPGESFVRARLDRAGEMRRACRGAGALVHLGAVSIERDWDTLLASNAIGLTTCFEAARAAGITRIVFASTMHVLGMHQSDAALDETSEPAPDTRYAATKLFGEAVCRLYAARFGLCVTAMRIGHVVPRIEDAMPGQGVSERDLARLMLLVLGFENPGFTLIHAVSPAQGDAQSDGRLDALGFGFLDPDPRSAGAHGFRGGDFAR